MGVRPTEALSPEDERQALRVPEGFRVELVASEPTIAKPLNMAFDAQGRLWVTQTIEYPYPAPADRTPRDSLVVLSDTTGDGVYDSHQVFADQLNIPMGVLPYGDGAIVFSIPNIWYLRDTDGDGVCDKREVVLGPFDTTRDTHGMVNALRMGDDGWIYACHGFNNQSEVAGSDGHVVRMNSGNTFRFLPDGSRIELVGRGQVNPFGMVINDFFAIFTADCHSKPLTQIIPGGSYPSFGRPHDGLGFIPPMMDHLHGSTAISGLTILDDQRIPEPYRGDFLSGNVMTSRLNRNRIERTGATYRAVEEPDFLISDDPWFRPVDIRLGPDGAIYVADFYNRIIGHYEVPLEHPGRDRHRGRIWRIVPTEGERADRPTVFRGAQDATPARLAELLVAESATLRNLAQRELNRRPWQEVASVGAMPRVQQSPVGRAGWLWIAARHEQLDSEAVRAASADEDALVRNAAALLLADPRLTSPAFESLVRQLVGDDDARVAAAAARATPRYASPDLVAQLSERIASADRADAILVASLRIALRDCLERLSAADSAVVAEWMDEPAGNAIAGVLPGLDAPSAGMLGLEYLLRQPPEAAFDAELVTHIARWLDPALHDALVELGRSAAGEPLQRQQQWLEAIQAGFAAGGYADVRSLQAWSQSIVLGMMERFEATLSETDASWVSWTADPPPQWPLQTRQTPEGDAVQLRSSHAIGESYVGTLRSGPFTAPSTLRFRMAGHNGPPSEPDSRENFVALRMADSGRQVQVAYPERNDQARTVEWDLSNLAGQDVRIECVDRDDAGAYAWIAIGDFDLPALNPSNAEEQLDTLRAWATRWPSPEVESRLAVLVKHPQLGSVARLQLATALAKVRGDSVAAAVLEVAGRYAPSQSGVARAIELVDSRSAEQEAQQLVREFAAGLSTAQQHSLAEQLLRNSATAPWVVDGIVDGWIARDVLRSDELVRDLQAALPAEEFSRLDPVLQSLPDVDETRRQLVAQLLRQLETRRPDVDSGARLFKANCAVCHKLGDIGEVVGPQLDGAGGRSAARLLEDVVLPSENVDAAFRTTTFLLDDGEIVSGLAHESEDGRIEVRLNDGKSRFIAPDRIVRQQPSNQSLMPSGLVETLGHEGLLDVIAYLRAVAVEEQRQGS